MEKRAHVTSLETSADDGLVQKTRVRRVFSFAQIFFFALTYMSSWECMALNLSASLYNGGPRALVFGSMIVIAGALAQSASLAEMASAQPIAGAQYHWVWAFTRTSKHRRFLTWMQGWVTWFAWVSTLAGVVNTTVYMLQSLVIANYGDAYTPERWHLTLLIFALLIVSGLLNMFAWRAIPWLETIVGVLHVSLYIIFMAVLLSTSSKSDRDFVFLQPQAASGWDSPFVAFNLGMITPLWGFVGFDGVVHMSEEVRRARLAVPRAMFYTIALNGVMAWSFFLVLLYCIGDLDAAMNAPFPIIEICAQATGSTGAAVAMVSGLLVVSCAVSVSSVTSASRLTWAWARDGGLPAWFARVSPTFRIPVRSVWLPVLVVMVLACLNIGSTAAFGAFIALASFAIFASYLFAIGSMLRARLRGEVQFGEWRLGKLGLPLNVFALVYTAWMMVFLVFPTALPVTGLNFNYALPIFAFVFFLAILLWFAWARTSWRGLDEKVIDYVIANSDSKTVD